MNQRIPPWVRIADILGNARARNASDVHLAAGLPPVMRVDGLLERTDETPVDPVELAEITEALLGARAAARVRDEGDVTGAWHDPAFGRIRVHAYCAGGHPAAAIRLLHRTVPSLESLRVPAAIGTLASQRHGIVVVAGPTGSGKSTTLAALIESVNAQSAQRVITIEDPIEYRHESRRSVITQREVGRDTPSFAAALRGALRSDPDVIVIGEMRDAETISGALSAAQTGHLVLATVHTGSAPQAVERVVDAFPDALRSQIRAQLANALIAITCQHLVPRAAAAGRRALVEVLLATGAVRQLIRDAKTHQLKNAMATGGRLGMQTLEQHAQELVRSGEVAAADLRPFLNDAEAAA